MSNNKLEQIAVFCGSSLGYEPSHRSTAREVGIALAQQNIGVIYGGTKLGMTGCVADGVLEAGGKLIGVMPDLLLEYTIGHEGVDQMISAKTLAERKDIMLDLCDGVIVLSGGYGTLDELLTMLLRAQMSLHNKPIGLLNINGYYDELLAMFKKMERYGFLRNAARNILIDSTDIHDLLDKMRKYKNIEKKKIHHKDIL